MVYKSLPVIASDIYIDWEEFGGAVASHISLIGFLTNISIVDDPFIDMGYVRSPDALFATSEWGGGACPWADFASPLSTADFELKRSPVVSNSPSQMRATSQEGGAGREALPIEKTQAAMLLHQKEQMDFIIKKVLCSCNLLIS